MYRGSRRPGLVGAYIYGDYCSDRIWMLRYQNGVVSSDSLLIDSSYMISSFGTDQDNELYILNHSSTGKIYKFNVNEFVNIKNLNKVTPENYFLKQNYPNPFNPYTIIEFGISEQTPVLLTIYNSLRKEIKTIINTTLKSGNYSIIFNSKDNFGIDVSSGVYFYTLKTNSFIETRRMVLIK